MVEAARGADLVVLPELWAAGYFAFDDYAAQAEPLHNTAVLIAPDGVVTHTYRKVHVFGHGSREAARWWHSGPRLATPHWPARTLGATGR